MTVYFILALALCAICGYLLGSINASLIVGKFYGVDVRQHGSGNAGMTNVLRTLGKKAAAFTFLGDFLKGIVACLVGSGLISLGLLLFGADVFGTISDPSHVGLMAAGAFCVFGHNWPIYFGFKGGKGVLTSLAVLIMMGPVPALIALGFFIVIVALTRYISLGSMLAALFLPVLVGVSSLFGVDFGVGSVASYLIFCIPLAVLIVIRHHKNIVKLLNGTENKFSFHKKKEETEG